MLKLLSGPVYVKYCDGCQRFFVIVKVASIFSWFFLHNGAEADRPVFRAGRADGWNIAFVALHHFYTINLCNII